MGHLLDAEHVSALISRGHATKWKALYWYAAAHEDTVCDDSQIARASTLGAEDHGPQIWISRGKHASFLSDLLCQRGCGGDECRNLQPLVISAIINLGEPSAAVDGATWVDSPQWLVFVRLSIRSPSFPHVFSGNPGGKSDWSPIETLGETSIKQKHC